jgi:anti-anti-sigma factor
LEAAVFELYRKVADGPLAVRSIPDGDDVVIVALEGELDRSNVATAAEVLDAVVAADVARIVLDLQALDFMDSSGVDLLSGVSERSECGGRIQVVPSKALGVSRIMAKTGMDLMVA